MGIVKFQKSHFTGPGFLQVVEGVFSKCGQEEMALFAGLARRIWLRRNNVLHGGSFSHPNVIMQLATRALDDFKNAQGNREQDTSNSEPQPLSCWMAPRLVQSKLGCLVGKEGWSYGLWRGDT